MAESLADARQEVANARLAADAELDEMGSAVRAAVDIPTKVKRQPLKYGALGAGAAFLALNGPKRAIKGVEKRFFPRRHERRLTPKEIDRVIDRLPEEERDAVRRRLEREFAAYLRREHPKPEPNARRSLWSTYDMFAGIVGGALMRELAKRFVEAPANRNPAPRKSPPADEEAVGL
ncbi:hypothetical protein BH23CHL7_BH23CHL7_24620 [soil metagenome]